MSEKDLVANESNQHLTLGQTTSDVPPVAGSPLRPDPAPAPQVDKGFGTVANVGVSREEEQPNDKGIPISHGNQHLVIGAPPTEPAPVKEVVKDPNPEAPEFAPGRPLPRTDINADPHEVTSPGFQGLDKAPAPPLIARDPEDVQIHRGAPNEPAQVGEARNEAEWVKANPESDSNAPSAAPLKQGHLPEDFPGYAALQVAGEATYGRIRRRIETGTLTDIPGIGDATAGKIEEAMAE